MNCPSSQVAGLMSQESRSPEVTEVLGRFMEAGGLPIDPTFTVADPSQAEIILNGSRMLITPRDEEYRRYTKVMDAAGLPYVFPNGDDPGVVVAEIPRDARALPQVMRSRQPQGGDVIRKVFETTGRSVNAMIRASHMAPKAGMISLRKILILRSEREVMFIPPLGFEPLDDDSKPKIAKSMQDQLLPEYARFGGALLKDAFERGLYHDNA